MTENQDLIILQRALTRLKEGFSSLPDSLTDENSARVEEILLRVAEKMHDNYPYFQPGYAGQMLKPPHAVARLAYMLALYVNPNNHALDGGRASSAMEKDAVRKIAGMFGWKKPLGHLTGGGTMANLEALWIAGKLNPWHKIVASESAHYTHERITSVLGLPFEKVKSDRYGRMDLIHLEELVEKGTVGTVVLTAGTTGTGSVDHMVDLLKLRERFPFRIHVDAAYGGYFRLAGNLDESTKANLEALTEADSLVIDPHKHGLQPYGCGCVLFKDPAAGRYYKHDSPYTYFTSSDMHLGEISLECSRAGASAVALWATLEMFPLEPGGEFAKGLEAGHQAALLLYEKFRSDNRFITIMKPELDIILWAPSGLSLSEISRKSELLFRKAAEKNLHLALIKYPAKHLGHRWDKVIRDQEMVTCLRSCLMKPQHLLMAEEIWEIISGTEF